MIDCPPLLARLLGTTTPEGIAIGDDCHAGQGPSLSVSSPIDGRELARFNAASTADVQGVVARAARAFPILRSVPAPRRGEFVRQLGLALRQHQRDLAALVTWEAGKISQEALGEVQEMIDICDFAVGLSRQLYGVTMPSERPEHRLTEQWHPLGPVGVITAFNFPVAVWAWNTALALVCGDPVVWKPSEKAPLTALACQRIANQVLGRMPEIPRDAISVVVGGVDAGRALVDDERLPLISATGSVRMGRAVAQRVAARLGRSLLELGGNNALIVAPSADLDLALRSIVFAAVGTAGQRCTSLRRLIVHESLVENLWNRLESTYARLPIGNPFDEGVLVGPLIDEAAYSSMQNTLAQARQLGGRVGGGERVTDGVPAGGVYVRPALMQVPNDAPLLQEETFAPVLAVLRYSSIQDAIALNNGVPQGLASAIFTRDMREAELFCSAAGSDCGIVNVNIGTSGAEIGGAFGGEKQTGGGRESGSDAWKSYMRRATNTVNYSTALPLAQGIRFDIE